MRRRRHAAYATTPLLITATCVVTACGVDIAGARDAAAGGGHEDPLSRPTLSMAAVRPAASAAAAVDHATESVVLEGDDFTLRYPGDASLRRLEPADAAPGALAAIEIRGPALRDVEGDPIEGSATYSFEIVTYENAERLPLERWLAQHRVGENANDALRSADPSHPRATPPTSAAVGGLPALRESRFGGDCDLVRYYVARGARVVALRYADFPVESDSLNPENLRTYRRVMSTFRWKASGGGSGA
jgi:hypothetical protein